ncbi:MAG: HEAT repeat domain-containing protein [Spirochaetia bacterium]|nr:HEAT repeat domain-containing protein [Spirochaetia bacterium]
MNKKIPFIVLSTFFLFFLLNLNCGSAPVKDEKKTVQDALDAETEEKSVDAGDYAETIEILKKVIENPPPDNPNSRFANLDKLSEIPDKKALDLLVQYASHKDIAIRDKAVTSLRKRQENAPAEKIEEKLFEIIENNNKTYGKLTASEIQALGQISDSRSAFLLEKNLGVSKEDDALIIQSLGRRLEKHEQQKDKPALVSAEEKVLQSYLKSADDKTLEKLALSALYFSSLKGRQKVFDIAADGEYKISTREAAIALYTDNNPASQEKIAGDYRSLYLKSKGNVDLKEVLVIEMARIMGKSPEEVLNSLRKEIERRNRAERLRKEALEKKRKWLLFMKNKSPKEALGYFMREYGINAGTVKKMDKNLHRHISEMGEVTTASKKFIFSALRALRPKDDYYALKKTGLKSLNNKGIFSALMREVLGFHHSQDLQIISLKQVWGINYSEAVQLKFFFKDKRKTLKEFNL